MLDRGTEGAKTSKRAEEEKGSCDATSSEPKTLDVFGSERRKKLRLHRVGTYIVVGGPLPV